MLQLTDNLFHVILQDDALLRRKVQRLVGCVGEERILLHPLPQRSAVQEIVMEQQTDGFRCGTVLQPMDADRLSRSEAHDRFVVEIIDRLSVVDDAPSGLFEKQRIKSQRHPVRRLRHGAVEMHDADQRVACLEAEKTVVLFDGVGLYYIRSMIHIFNNVYFLFAVQRKYISSDYKSIARQNT